MNTEEGRIVTTGSTPEYQYHLKDHLGNVRVTFTTVEQIETSMATLEATEADTEQSEFLRYDESVKVTAKLFDHTHRDEAKATKVKGKPVEGGEVSMRLSGIGEERYGLAKSIRVMPGDKIRMEVFAKYIDPDKNNWQPTFSDALSALTEAGPAPALDGALQRAAGASSIPLTALLTKTPGGKAPKAYLNYVMYDNDFNPIMDPAQTNFIQVTEASKESGRNGNHERLFAEVEAKEAGYMYIYLSNDNYELQGEQVDVFFDDFEIEQVHSAVVQSDDYYPFGLTFNSYSRENSTENRYLYNQGIGEKTFKTERIFDLSLNVDMTKFRVYDPAIGRWWQVDPLADEADFTSLTPYNYSFNNPIRYSDAYGDCPICPAIPWLVTTGTAVLEGATVAAGTTALVALAKAIDQKIGEAANANGGGYSPAVGFAMSSAKPGELTSGKMFKSNSESSTSSSGDSGKNGGSFGNKKDTKTDGDANKGLKNAKEANGIPTSQQPDKTIKPNTPEGDAAGLLSNKNVKQYEFTDYKGQKVIIRQDKAANYNDGGKGDQGPHYNAGSAEDNKLKQHHYYEQK